MKSAPDRIFDPLLRPQRTSSRLNGTRSGEILEVLVGINFVHSRASSRSLILMALLLTPLTILSQFVTIVILNTVLLLFLPAYRSSSPLLGRLLELTVPVL